MRTKQNKTFEVLSMFRTCPNKLNCLKERRKTPKKNVISSGRIKFQLLYRNYHYYSRPQNNLQPAKAFLGQSPKIILFWGLHLEIIIIITQSQKQFATAVLQGFLLFSSFSSLPPYNDKRHRAKNVRKGTSGFYYIQFFSSS